MTTSRRLTDEPSISERIAEFAAAFSFDDIPAECVEYAKLLVLDSIGIALASTTYDFAHRTLQALAGLGRGDSVVIGTAARLGMRDAVLMNGVLIHGVDYDDTHSVGVVHPSSSCLPTAVGLAAALGSSGRDLLAAYVLGIEVAARIGAVAKGELNQIGFHPTGVVAAFGTAVAAGHLYRLGATEIAMAQGIVLSMAAGPREYSRDAAWTKRLHPGWAGACGITAAALARSGFVGPRQTYEGKYGLFATHLGAAAAQADLSLATAGLGERWEVGNVAVKPFPAGQFGISCIDAAIALKEKHRIDPSRIAHVEAAVPPHAVPIMLEPLEMRRRPRSSYAAQFSIPFLVACGLTYARVGLSELELFEEPQLLALAAKVGYRVDEQTDYPRHFPCTLTVTLADGQRIVHAEPINRGAPDRPVSAPEIAEKFRDNALRAVSRGHAERIRRSVIALEREESAKAFAELLAGR